MRRGCPVLTHDVPSPLEEQFNSLVTAEYPHITIPLSTGELFLVFAKFTKLKTMPKLKSGRFPALT